MLEIKQHSNGTYTILHTETKTTLMYFDFGIVLSKQISTNGEKKVVAEIAKIVEREMAGSEYE